MPNTILIKKSGTASAVPSTLSFGELALNYADGRLYYKNSAGSIVPLTANSGLNAKLAALTFNGTTTTFNLVSGSTAITPANASSLLISLNGVIQEPGVAYTVSGSQITFVVAPVSTDTFFGVHLTGGSSGSGGSGSSTTTVVALTYAATINTDASAGSIFDVTLTGGATLANPTNPIDGKTLRWRIRQDGTGNRAVTLGNKFVIPSSATNPLPFSTAANKMDILAATYHLGRDKWDIVAFVPGY